MFDFELYGLYRKRWSNRLATQPSVWKRERTQYQRMLQNGCVEDFFLLMLELPDVFMSFFQPDSAGQLELCRQIDISTSNKRELARLFIQIGPDFASYASLLESSLFDRFLLDAYGHCNTLTQQEVQLWRKIVSRMALIEGGRFYMNPYPSYRDSVEYRGIVVHITRNFLISRYPVTQMLWQYVMGENPSVHKGTTRPVGNISWFEAIGFCNALSRMEGFETAYSIHDQKVSLNRWSQGYRLPSEAEWEYAARARPFPPLIDCLYATYPDLFQKLP
ncbi:MAG: SUMF1/EgtB/PvdO family nonheme iron enzyme, partial [Myxococcota bacterium]|nr:SUMF1/EgtB/PvdO family nonheme iron enzyme [Myxococcota bacterium]